MNPVEFQLLVMSIALKIKHALKCDPPEPTMSAFKVNRILTADHIIKTQAELINEICNKVDCLKTRNEILRMRNRKLSNELGWLRSPAYTPMGVKING